MMQKAYLLVVITTFVLFSSVSSATDQEIEACKNRSNSDCTTCMRGGDRCAFCKDTKKCFYIDTESAAAQYCGTNNLQWRTCVGNIRVWIIVVVVLVVLVVLVIFIVLCCLCRKCKQCKIRKLQRREQQDNQRMEERRVAAEARTNERTRVTDQLRMKYGILKEKDTGTDYTRMS